MMRTNREMTLYEVHEESVSCITEPYEVPSLLWFSCPDNFLPRTRQLSPCWHEADQGPPKLNKIGIREGNLSTTGRNAFGTESLDTSGRVIPVMAVECLMDLSTLFPSW